MRHKACELETKKERAIRSAVMLNIHTVKTGYEFVASSDLKVYGIDRPHHSKLSTQETGFKKLRICMSDSMDTCGRKANPQRKKCGFKNIRIRVDGTLVNELSRRKNVVKANKIFQEGAVIK